MGTERRSWKGKIRRFKREHEILLQILMILGVGAVGIGATYGLFKLFYKTKTSKEVAVAETVEYSDTPDEWADANQPLSLPVILERTVKVQSLRAENGDPLNSFSYRGQVTLFEADRNRTGRAIVFFKMPDKLRVSLSGPRMRYNMGYNGREGWASTEQNGEIQAISLSRDELRRARHSTLLSTPAGYFLSQTEACERIDDGEASFGDTPVYVVRFRHGDGVSQEFHIDRRSYMVLKRVIRDGDREVAAEYEDFRRIGDAWAAFRIRTLENGLPLNQYVITDFTINAGVLGNTFEMP